MRDLKKLISTVLENKNLEEREEQVEMIEIIVNRFIAKPNETKKPQIIAAGTSAGKTNVTIIAIEIANMILETENRVKNNRILIIPSSQSILLDNFAERIESLHPGFTWATISGIDMKRNEIIKSLNDKSIKVLIILPQLVKNYLNHLPEFHTIIVDEAHGWYSKEDGVISKVIETIKPKNQILLTGTPFIFNQRKDLYDFHYLPAIELYDKKRLSEFGIEILTTNTSFKYEDYKGAYEGIKTDTVKISESEVLDSLNTVLYQLHKKLKIKGVLKNQRNFNYLTNNIASNIFGTMKKTIIVCSWVNQADVFYKLLNSQKGLEGKVLVSHGESDKKSENFERFKTDEDINILVVVDRGRLGFDMAELFNIVDFTYTQNLKDMLQMMGRIFRQSKLSKEKKIYYKVSPQGYSYFFEKIMTAAILLLHRKWYERFNLKNIGQIELPVDSTNIKKRKNNTTTRKESEKILLENDERRRETKISPIIHKMEIPLGLDIFEKIIHRDDDTLSSISYMTLDEIRKETFGLKRSYHEYGLNDAESIAKFIEENEIKSRKDFNNKFQSLYQYLLIEKEDIINLLLPPIYVKGKYDKEESVAEMIKENGYDRISDMPPSMIRALRRNGLIHKFFNVSDRSHLEWVNDLGGVKNYLGENNITERSSIPRKIRRVIEKNGILDKIIPLSPKVSHDPGFDVESEEELIGYLQKNEIKTVGDLIKTSVGRRIYHYLHRKGTADKYLTKSRQPLSEVELLEIENLVKSGETIKRISEITGRSTATIKNIKRDLKTKTI